MLALFAFAIGIMYTPGPVNLLALSNRLHPQGTAMVGFNLGVGVGVWLPLSLVTLVGQSAVNGPWMPWIGMIGAVYILYLGVKVARSSSSLTPDEKPPALLTFRDGLLMQLLNPKMPIAVVPLAGIYIPGATSSQTVALLLCAVVGLLAAGAPGTWGALGHLMRLKIQQQYIIGWINRGLALLLIYSALVIAYGALTRSLEPG